MLGGVGGFDDYLRIVAHDDGGRMGHLAIADKGTTAGQRLELQLLLQGCSPVPITSASRI